MRTVSSEEQRLIQESVAKLADKEYAPHAEVLNHYPDCELPSRFVESLAELGLFDLLLPADSGGGDGDLQTLSTALETLSEKLAAPAGILFAHSFAQQLAINGGDKRSAERLAGNGTPTLLAYPIYDEPGDCASSVICRKDGKNLILEGTCELVVNAPIANLLVLPVYQESKEHGCSIALIEPDRQGVEIGESLLTLGLRGCPTADVTLRGVEVSAGELIPGACELTREMARRFRGPASAICAGITGSSLRTASGYAQERYQAGCNIIEHQQVRSMLADMLADYQSACDAADKLSSGATISESAAATLFVRSKKGAARACTDGVQLLGGYGYMEDYGQERRMRDAKQAQCLLGRTDPLRQDAVADWLTHEEAL